MSAAMSENAALKDWFDEARYRRIADDLAGLQPGFDRKRFLALTLEGLAERSLLQRLRRTSEAMRATLPEEFPKALVVLRKLAPKFRHNFVSLVLPDYVGLYGQDDFERSMDALKFFTPFGSSEFAVREFLRRDLPRTLAVMETWSRDADEYVRRLAMVVQAAGTHRRPVARRAHHGESPGRSEPLRAQVGREPFERHHQGSSGLGVGADRRLGPGR